MAAVESGVKMVQGTINGYGECTGNANLISVIPNLALKMNLKTNADLSKLSQVSHNFNELLNQSADNNQAYVDKHVFAHKGGMHAAGIAKDSSTFEHILPEVVGNERQIVTSELSGKSSVELLLKDIQLKISKEQNNQLVDFLKTKEAERFSYESAEASFFLEVYKKLETSFRFGNWKILKC